MTDEERIDQRARMGLRVLLKLHEAFPSRTDVIPRDAFARGEKTDAEFQNISMWGESQEPEIALAQQLIERMLEDGVIRGEKNNRGVSGATIPAHTRQKLNTGYVNGTGLLGESIRAELQRIDAGKPARRGLLVHMAREAGFEP